MKTEATTEAARDEDVRYHNTEEEKAHGSIDFRVYRSYMKAVGQQLFACILVFVVLMRGKFFLFVLFFLPICRSLS